MGLDRDEIDLYLDAQVQKLEQAIDAAVRKQKGKQCPHCGAYVSQLTDKCPECNQYITPEATRELEEILDNLEEALINMKARKDYMRNKATVERYSRKARMYYSNHPKIKQILLEVEDEMQMAESNIKSVERKEAVSSVMKNKFVWIGLVIGFGVILYLIGLGIDSKALQDFGSVAVFLGIFPLIVGFSISKVKEN